MDNWINVIPIGILIISCGYLIFTNDWRKSLISYAVIYMCAFIVITQYWTFTFSLVKLITGLMSLVVLGVSINHQHEKESSKTKSEWIFQLVSLGLLFTVITYLGSGVSNYLSLPLEIILSSLVIIVFSVFQLGITHTPYRIILSIMILFFGFELIFSSNEPSLLVNGLLAIVTLLVAFMGGFLITNEYEGTEE